MVFRPDAASRVGVTPPSQEGGPESSEKYEAAMQKLIDLKQALGPIGGELYDQAQPLLRQLEEAIHNADPANADNPWQPSR